MILIEYRGRGLLAIIGPVAALAAVGALVTVNILLTIVAASLMVIASGLLCRHYGGRRRDDEAVDTMFDTPLDAWGTMYLWGGGVSLLLSVALILLGIGFRLANNEPVTEMFRLNR